MNKRPYELKVKKDGPFFIGQWGIKINGLNGCLGYTSWHDCNIIRREAVDAWEDALDQIKFHAEQNELNLGVI